MADKATIFFLDEDPELGGFDDPVEIIEENPDEKAPAEEPTEPEEKKGEPEKVEPEKKEPDRFAETLKMVQSLSEQNKALMEQNKALIEKQSKPVEPVNPPEKPVFTPAQWEDDCQGCTEAIIQYNDEVKQYHGTIENQKKEQQIQSEQQKIQSAHAESWALSTDYFPELAEMENGQFKNPDLRNAWATVFNSPDTGYKNDPNGPLKATRDLKRFITEKGLKFGKQEEAKPVEPEPKAKNLEEENARLSRIVKGTMHGAGQTKIGDKKINLTKEQLQACERLNCSPEAYAASLSAL